MSLALSCSWNAFRQASAEGIIFEIESLGFKAIELSFNLSPEIIARIERPLQESGLKVVSLHNYCPVPRGLPREKALPDCYSLASREERERKTALKFTKVSIDTAARLGAKALVLHCGRVEVPDRTREMISFYIGGKKETAAFRQLREEAISQRKDAAAPYLAAALKSIEELEAYARKKNIILGIENRFYYREIPSLSEIGEILKRFSGGCVAYWHDTGHAQVTENLGFAEHKDYLDLYAEFIAGIHLHDIIGCQDHLAPGKGQFDFAQLKKYLKASTLKVIEAHHPAGAEEIRDGKACLEKIFNEPN